MGQCEEMRAAVDGKGAECQRGRYQVEKSEALPLCCLMACQLSHWFLVFGFWLLLKTLRIP